MPSSSQEHLDVLIVGAGISGIDAAYHLQKRCPAKSWAIVEARDAIGGTWDLFRYPGIRSDSDMYTLGFPFRPWTGEKAIADGPRHQGLCRGDGARLRHRSEDPLRPQGGERRLVVRRGALDGRDRDGGRRAAADLLASCSSAAAITITSRATGRPGRARRPIAAASSIRNSGPRISIMRASTSS